jgi:isoamylase
MAWIVEAGDPRRMGPIWEGGRVWLCVRAPAVGDLRLLVFRWGEPDPAHVVQLDPKRHREGSVWHMSLHLPPGDWEYAFQLGDHPELVGDPYARCLGSRRQWRGEDRPGQGMARGLLSRPPEFDWQGTQPPRHPRDQLVVYETHMRAFTMDDSRNPHPGTYLGMVERLDHLVDLGITAIELLPIVEFDEKEYRKVNPLTEEPLCQFWGYSPRNFFAPMRRYCAHPDEPYAPQQELKTLIRECHRRGLSVILDLVYNHTAWPNVSWQRLDPEATYLVDEHGHSTNYSGCGNTVHANDPATCEMIVESLRRWARDYRIDGFRFDLTACLWRGADGGMMTSAPVIRAIESDPELSLCHLIAEPWDAAGAYQVGWGYSPRWMQWNGSYRDVVRRFLKGDSGQTGAFAGRLCGSQDLFQYEGHPAHATPLQSVNFITCHDGFTLGDLVAYNHKHNLANGEENRDGASHNDSWNCGVEGPTQNPDVVTLRHRQMRKAMICLLASQGVPMILMGDEVGLSRQGNNNAWCQDNALNAFPWAVAPASYTLYHLVRSLLQLRARCPQLRSTRFLTAEDVVFQAETPGSTNWDADASIVAMRLPGPSCEVFLAISRAHHVVDLKLPDPGPGKIWQPYLDSRLPLAPLDAGLWVSEATTPS